MGKKVKPCSDENAAPRPSAVCRDYYIKERTYDLIPYYFGPSPTAYAVDRYERLADDTSVVTEMAKFKQYEHAARYLKQMREDS